MPELAGTNSIDYYLKGVQIRQQKEHQLAQQAQQQENARLDKEKLDNDLRKADTIAKETERWHDLQDKYKQNEAKLKQLEHKLSSRKAVEEGLLRLKDPKAGYEPENLEETELGTAVALKQERELALAQGKSSIKVGEALATEQVVGPAKTQNAVNTAVAIDEKVNQPKVAQAQEFTAEQNELNRAARREEGIAQRAAARLNHVETLNQRKAEHADTKESSGAVVSSHLEGLFNGDTTRESLKDLPLAERSQVLDQVNKSKMIVLTNKEKEQAKGLTSLKNFYGKIKQLNTLLQSGNVGSQVMSSQISALQESLEADLTIFGREAKGEKGVVTDKDIPRLRGAVPSILPGGLRSLGDKKGRKKSNQYRVDDVGKTYFEKVDMLFKRMKPAQRKAMEERFDIMAREEKIED